MESVDMHINVNVHGRVMVCVHGLSLVGFASGDFVLTLGQWFKRIADTRK